MFNNFARLKSGSPSLGRRTLVRHNEIFSNLFEPSADKISAMRIGYYSILFCIFLGACSQGGAFSAYQREEFGEVMIGKGITKSITLQNSSVDSVEHIVMLDFDAGTNEGHFKVDKVEIGGTAANPKNKDISIPAGSFAKVFVTYQPLNMQTTVADYGGWRTGEEERFKPHKPKPVDAMKVLVGAKEEKAIHRAILAVTYDHPSQGLIQIELIGEARPGADGETTAGGFGGECPEEGGTACYKGGFAIELPDIMTGGPKPLTLTGAVVFKLSGANAEIDMASWPAALLVLSGNGPGEPLEGKPINAISIVISGVEGVTASGTFDGARLDINDIAFRIRVVLGEITADDINPGLQSAVDFNLKGLTLTTQKPYTNGAITLSIETTLPKEPSGNPMFDQFLGGTRIIVTMDGELSL